MHGVLQLRLVGWFLVGTGGLQCNFLAVSESGFFFLFVFNLDQLIRQLSVRQFPTFCSHGIFVSTLRLYGKKIGNCIVLLYGLQNAMICGIL